MKTILARALTTVILLASAATASAQEACDAAHYGGMRYYTNVFQFCDTSNTWRSVAELANNAGTDRISTTGVSSGANLGMAVASAGTISFTLGGTAGAAYLHPSLGLVAPGVSTTGPISGTRGYFNGYVGIGTTTPSTTLHVVGGSDVTGVNTTGMFIIGSANGPNLGIDNNEIEARNVGNTSTTLYLNNNSKGLTHVGGDLRVVDQLQANTADTLAAPGFTWYGDEDTGLWHPAADYIGIVTAGVERARITSAGISTTGTVKAASFSGDGSALTNIAGDNLGNHTATAALVGTVGTVALPAYTFTGDTNTGMYWVGADQIGMTVGGVQQLLIRSTGLIVSGSVLANNVGDVATAPSYSWSGDTNTGMYWVASDQIGLTTGGVQRALINSSGLRVVGYVSTTGIIDAGGAIYGNVNDSVTAPGYTWSGDTNTGMYWVGADQIGLTAGGAQRMLVNTTGVTVTGAVTATYFSGDGSRLTNIAGDNLGNHTATQALAMGANTIGFGNTVTDKLYWYSNTYGTGMESGNLTNWGSAFRWRIGGTSVSTGSQQMILNTTGLVVSGSLAVNNDDLVTAPGFTWNGDTNTGMYWVGADQIGITVGGVQQLLIRSTGLTVSGSVLANNVGDVATAPSYSWSGDTNTGMYWVGADQVGVSTGGAQRGLFSAGGLKVTGTVTTTGIIDAGSYIYGYAGDSAAAPGYTWSGDNNSGMYNAAADVVGFTAGGTERARINASGISTTGSIYLNSGGSIVADSADTNYTSSLGLYGGAADANTGATIALYGIDHTSQSGRILMYAVSDTAGALLYRFYSRTSAGANSSILTLYQGGNATLTGTLTASAFSGDGSNLTGIESLAANSVTSAHIVDGTITAADIATGGVATAEILDGTVSAADIASNAVTAAEIATDGVGASEIAAGAVGTSEILDGTITAADIATSAVTGAEILDSTITAADIASNAVTTVKILDNNVTTAKINTGAVTANELASNAVTTVKVADSAITLVKIQNISTNRLLGRATASTGNVEQITVGAGLEFSGTTLTATASNVFTKCTNTSTATVCAGAKTNPTSYRPISCIRDSDGLPVSGYFIFTSSVWYVYTEGSEACRNGTLVVMDLNAI